MGIRFTYNAERPIHSTINSNSKRSFHLHKSLEGIQPTISEKKNNNFGVTICKWRPMIREAGLVNGEVCAVMQRVSHFYYNIFAFALKLFSVMSTRKTIAHCEHCTKNIGSLYAQIRSQNLLWKVIEMGVCNNKWGGIGRYVFLFNFLNENIVQLVCLQKSFMWIIWVNLTWYIF